ncbi:LTA synthase family protein [Pseudomonas sp. URMO17WK12:I2]|uniref:LTA synthase family protein n=1 Tax=Pseudomonas sp. URMO17WK12:I2 TaxID=1261623 RepID=UPI000DAC1A6B|nr:LTA synthase family protein [Pseudomonas sp. URMO17WK12:I2]PZW44578.1 phosphoglycerol transferase MdoB-like AlkP superfamily enzyme [Pseudomonas sp. URMO17WK12:I2]
MRALSPWLQRPTSVLLTLAVLFIAVPLLSRYSLGWSHPFGYLSDLAIGSLLLWLALRRRLLLGIPLAVIWVVLNLGTVELVSAVGRMPEPADLHYLTDPQFLSHSTQGGGLTHPWLAGASILAALALIIVLATRPPVRKPSMAWLLAPVALLAIHAVYQYRSPSEADQWVQFNLPHKWLAEGVSLVQLGVEDWMSRGQPNSPPDVSGLTSLDMDGTPLLGEPGRARNVLIITLEGIPGAYLDTSRRAIGSHYQDDLMPRLSAWAERGMLTSDYVLHAHQTIRGLYAMLCGDYDKLASGTPKGLELLGNAERAAQCLPAQLRDNGFSTHFLQGAGLRFMAKDQIMPRMGFDKTLGRDWFRNTPYLDFAWGMDDRSYFEGALSYVDGLRKQKTPWMLTLLTVGTHQPYSAPADYLERHGSARQAAIAYLDDAIGDFLDGLQQRGVLDDTLVVVTSDESHGIENVRLASAWGFNLMLAPEQAQLPSLKHGVYGHIDLTASILDYLALPLPADIAGRSMLRDYAHGRQIISYTNGLLREHDGQGTLTECNFQQVCRRYASPGFITEHAEYLGRVSGKPARQVSLRAELLDRSLTDGQGNQVLQFASNERIRLRTTPGDDWADNLIGAQYLELPKGTQTRVTLKINALSMSESGATLRLKTKEFDRDVLINVPEIPRLKKGQPVELSFAFDNLDTRKAFSFHLVGEGKGSIEISDFSVETRPIETEMLAAKVEEEPEELTQ